MDSHFHDTGSRGHRTWQSGLLPSRRDGSDVDYPTKRKRQNYKADVVRLQKELAAAQATLEDCREALAWPDGVRPTMAIFDLVQEIRLMVNAWQEALDASNKLLMK